MPVYEYSCDSCAKRFAKLVGVVAGASDNLMCPKCGSKDVRRLISRFSRIRSEDETLDAMEEAAFVSGDDPASMGKLMREMGKAIGEDGEEGIEELIEESEKEFYDGAGDAEFC